MKKIFMAGIFLVALLALGVSAADLTISTGSITIADKRPTEAFSESFIVSNATQNLSGLTLSQTGLGDFGINFTIGGTPAASFNLNVGEQKTIVLGGKVPKNINTRLSPYSGAIAISGSGISKTISLSIDAESQLDLDNVKSVVDGKTKSISDESDTIKDVKPGSKVEIKGDVQNLFTDNQDITIEDITVTVTIKNIDDDDDMEEDADVGDIDSDEKEAFKTTFEIPEDVEEDEYSVTIEVEADDENGAKHFVKWDELKLKVEKENHDVRIWKASVSPSKIDCNRKINLNVQLKNQGSNDEDEIVLRILNTELGIDVEDTSIPELDEGTGDDTEYSKTYTFTIDDKARSGTYPITIQSFYDTDELSETKTVDLVVESCKAPVEEQPPEEVVVVTPPREEQPEEETPEEEGEEPEIITGEAVTTTEVSFLQSNAYFVLLIGAIGVAVIVIIVMFVVILSMARKRRE